MLEPAGTLGLPVKYFRTMLSTVSAFQTWTEAADAARALPRIHYEQPPAPANKSRYTKDELARLRPFAVVYIADRAGFVWQIESTDTFERSGTVILELEQAAIESSGTDPSPEALMDWSNTIGLIADGLIARRVDVQDFHLMFQRIRLLWRGWATKDQAVAQGMFQRAILAVDF